MKLQLDTVHSSDSEYYIVFGVYDEGRYSSRGDVTTLTHVARSGKTLCGRLVPDDWYADEWGDGPECKVCCRAVAKMGTAPQAQERQEGSDAD